MADTGSLQNSLCDMMEQGVLMGVGLGRGEELESQTDRFFRDSHCKGSRRTGKQLAGEVGRREVCLGLVLRWENRARLFPGGNNHAHFFKNKK